MSFFIRCIIISIITLILTICLGLSSETFITTGGTILAFSYIIPAWIRADLREKRKRQEELLREKEKQDEARRYEEELQVKKEQELEEDNKRKRRDEEYQQEQHAIIEQRNNLLAQQQQNLSQTPPENRCAVCGGTGGHIAEDTSILSLPGRVRRGVWVSCPNIECQNGYVPMRRNIEDITFRCKCGKSSYGNEVCQNCRSQADYIFAKAEAEKQREFERIEAEKNREIQMRLEYERMMTERNMQTQRLNVEQEQQARNRNLEWQLRSRR